MTAHIDLTGIWRDCAEPDCALPFHLTGKSADEIQALNPGLLGELFDLEKLTPGPSAVGLHTLEWLDDDGERHRDYDLPALVHPKDNSRYWYRHGVLHRDHDRPAIEYGAGNREWWTNGVIHRGNDLPAMVDADGHQTWYTNGVIGRPSGLHDVLIAGGDRQWHDPNGMLHRDNGLPAVIRQDGTLEYWRHGEQLAWEDELGYHTF